MNNKSSIILNLFASFWRLFFISLFIINYSLFIPSAHAALPPSGPIANVQYLHNYLIKKHGINIPINTSAAKPAIPTAAANMKYLLCFIDKANNILNGAATTNYCNHAKATTIAVNTITVKEAVDNLVKEYTAPTVCNPQDALTLLAATPACASASTFCVALACIDAGEIFDFNISAKGSFTVNWGDGGATQNVNRTNTTDTTYPHTFQNAGHYVLVINGLATEYSSGATTPAISFANRGKVRGISGDLGQIFPVLNTSSTGSPRFITTFRRTTISHPIPANLFASVNGAPVSYMFYETFRDVQMGGSIPGNLFAGIQGPPADYMFGYTFYNCQNLTGPIPSTLFAGISGPPKAGMFSNTFFTCTKLNGSIPSNLFANISGAAKSGMFEWTFSGCSSLTGSIPGNLFAGITGTADNMFSSTFGGCGKLTGNIPANIFANISGAPKSGMFSGTFGGTGLTGSIPSNLFAGISGAPANSMFQGTFSSCKGLSGQIPGNLFSGISGAPASGMFRNTFYNCTGLESIGNGLFDNITGAKTSAMFWGTFNNCSGLTGPSATSNGQFIYEKWSDATAEPNINIGQVNDCYTGATGLSDWADIPKCWGGPKSTAVCP